VTSPRAEDDNLKIELDDQEQRAIGKSLVERKARLIENAGDTTQPRAGRRSGSFELRAIASVLRKLRSSERHNRQNSEGFVPSEDKPPPRREEPSS